MPYHQHSMPHHDRITTKLSTEATTGSFVPRLGTGEGLVRSFARRSSLVRLSLVCSSLVDLRSSSFDRRVSIAELRSSSFDRRASIVDRQITDRQIADRQIADRQIATFRQRDLRSAPRIGDRDVAISRDLSSRSSLFSLLSSLLSPDLRDRRSRELSKFNLSATTPPRAAAAAPRAAGPRAALVAAALLPLHF